MSSNDFCSKYAWFLFIYCYKKKLCSLTHANWHIQASTSVYHKETDANYQIIISNSNIILFLY